MFIKSAHAGSTFLPPAATQVADKVDSLYTFLMYASLISSLLVIVGFIVFSILFRRRSENDKTAYIPHNIFLEIAWSVIPFFIFMFVFAWGWMVFHEMRTPPKKALELQVYAQKWFWTFQYKSGKKAAGEVYVPVNQAVKFIMTSKDVIHSFFVPAFRTKQDVLPGRYTSFWFEARDEGSYQVFCSEYCGSQHAYMTAKINVVSRENYEKWLQDNPYKGLSLSQIGGKVYQTRCVACHTTTQAKNIGPGFQGIFRSKRKIEGGSFVIADENYLRESILNPNEKIVEGYPAGVMPTFLGQMSEEEVSGVIEYIKTLQLGGR